MKILSQSKWVANCTGIKGNLLELLNLTQKNRNYKMKYYEIYPTTSNDSILGGRWPLGLGGKQHKFSCGDNWLHLLIIYP